MANSGRKRDRLPPSRFEGQLDSLQCEALTALVLEPRQTPGVNPSKARESKGRGAASELRYVLGLRLLARSKASGLGCLQLTADEWGLLWEATRLPPDASPAEVNRLAKRALRSSLLDFTEVEPAPPRSPDDAPGDVLGYVIGSQGGQALETLCIFEDLKVARRNSLDGMQVYALTPLTDRE